VRRAVVTIACGEFFERLSAITHPTLRAYADKIGADFIVWNDYPGHTIPNYQKLELAKVLDQYDRVLFLDTDVLVRDDAPDVFDLVPEDQVGMLEESLYCDRTIDVIQYMIGVGYDARQWNRKYYNTGVLVLSKRHKNLFAQPAVELNHLGEQTYLNLMISRTQTRVFSLPYRFNRMYFMDWLYGEDRCDAYFIHYAGVSLLTSEDEYLKLVASDRASWEKTRPHYRFGRHIALVIEGGLGVQVSAEPIVRYARDRVYPGDHLVIVSTRPELFGHLGLPVYDKLDHVPEANRYQPHYTLSNTTHRESQCMDAERVHPVNFASLNALGVELPTASKRPQLPLFPAALTSVAEKVQPADPKSLVLLHPGRSDPASPIPPEVWKSYADALVQNGYRVALIGSGVEQDQKITELDAPGCLNLIDRLSVPELIALVAQARVLISSESGPLHVAGAFDNWIGLVGSTKHPEHVLHWRNGSQFWKAAPLDRLPLYDDRHRTIGALREVHTPQRLQECLPAPHVLLQFVEQAFANQG